MSWFEDQVKALMDRGWSRKDAEKAIEETLEPMEIDLEEDMPVLSKKKKNKLKSLKEKKKAVKAKRKVV
jgi:hypothetical protein